MGFRFFKRIKIFSGVSLNLSKSGMSISVGPRGFKKTFGPKGVRTTVGLPGTGIYWTEQSSAGKKRDPVDAPTLPMLAVDSTPAPQKSKGGLLISLAIILLLLAFLHLSSSNVQGMSFIVVVLFVLLLVGLYQKFVAKPPELISTLPSISPEGNPPAARAGEESGESGESTDVIGSEGRADGPAPPEYAAIRLQEDSYTKMNTAGKYEEKLPCGGHLRVTRSRWQIEYYFPGPDARYLGTSVNLEGASIDQYIKAFEDNWKEYEGLKSVVPNGGEFVKDGKMNMKIRIGGYRQGVCLNSYHLAVNSRKQLDVILDGYRYAKKRAQQIQELLASL